MGLNNVDKYPQPEVNIISFTIVILVCIVISLYFVITTLSIGDSTKIRMSSERGKTLMK